MGTDVVYLSDEVLREPADVIAKLLLVISLNDYCNWERCLRTGRNKMSLLFSERARRTQGTTG